MKNIVIQEDSIKNTKPLWFDHTLRYHQTHICLSDGICEQNGDGFYYRPSKPDFAHSPENYHELWSRGIENTGCGNINGTG